jgi:hypothetical protein
MASCPPAPFQDLTSETPFGNGHTHDHGGEFHALSQGTWELTKADLSTLLDLSRKLNLDGEITPVMAWGMVLSHSRFAELDAGDFEKLSAFFSSSAPCWELMLSHYYLGMLTLVNTVLALFWRSLNYGML